MSTFEPNYFVNPSERAAPSKQPPHALAFVGELDISLAREVRDLLDTITVRAQIDLSQVRYVDARIIGEFVRLANRIAPEKVQLFGVQPQVRRIFEIVRLDQRFLLCDLPYYGPCFRKSFD